MLLHATPRRGCACESNLIGLHRVRARGCVKSLTARCKAQLHVSPAKQTSAYSNLDQPLQADALRRRVNIGCRHPRVRGSPVPVRHWTYNQTSPKTPFGPPSTALNN